MSRGKDFKADKRSDMSETGMSFFSIEEEVEEDYEDAPLTWRGSPERTFSDCTLVITNMEDDVDQDTYHVHRAVLGASDRRSLYFMKASQKQGTGNSVHIEIEYRRAQEVMPLFLDFVYFGKLDISTVNAEALRHLAEFLQCRPMKLAVNKFIENDFKVTNAIHYVRECYQFNDKQLLGVTIRESAKLFGEIDMDDFTNLEPELFKGIVTSSNFTCKDEDKLSKAIIHYFHKKPEYISSTLLLELTNEIPSIRQQEAKAYLQLVEKVDPKENEDSWRSLSHLCIRCANAVAPLIWRANPVEAQKEFLADGWSGDGPSRLFVAQLVASLKYAQEQHNQQQKTVSDAQDMVAKSKSEVEGLKKKLAGQEKETVEAKHHAGQQKPERRNNTSLEIDSRDDISQFTLSTMEIPSSPRSGAKYAEICKDLALSLSNKLTEREHYISELEAQLEDKEAELERVNQLMVHLNARLKYYEIIHTEAEMSATSPTPKSPVRTTATRTRSPSPVGSSSTTSSMRTAVHSRTRSSPNRPERARPPASPRFSIRNALAE